MAERELYLGELSSGLGVFPGPEPTGLPRVCFFVHGYNVTPREAKQDFDDLVALARREAKVPEAVASPLLDGAQAWRVYWPSSIQVAGQRVMGVSQASYPLHVDATPDWASVLARHMEQHLRQPERGPVEVLFVAHSLGCRIVLELLRHKLMQHHRSWRVTVVLLMAAAVPVRLVQRGERLYLAANAPELVSVAFSRRDLVLQTAFRAGQLGEGGLTPTAVGVSGGPAGLWRKPLRTRNGHGDYFRDRRTARHLAQLLGYSVLRDLDRHPLAESQPPERKIASTPDIAKRDPAQRRIGGG